MNEFLRTFQKENEKFMMEKMGEVEKNLENKLIKNIE